MNRSKRVLTIAFVAVFLAFIFVFGIVTVLKTPDVISVSERRNLEEPPQLSTAAVCDGSFFTAYEKYMLDQFPLRDEFRRIKSINLFYLFHQTDNHGIFIEDNLAAQISYPMTEKSQSVYLKRLNQMNSDFFEGKNLHIYHTVIPDKAYFLAGEAGCPSIDYEALQKNVSEGVAAWTYIDIFDTLTQESYYKTDTHWAQEKILPTADKLLSAMGRRVTDGTYIKDTLFPFYGVYYGQSALPLSPDTIQTVGSPAIDSATFERVNRKTGKLETGDIYCNENIHASDAYDVFLGGASTVAVIYNTTVQNGKTLYLFSDSFGRSLASLLLSDYSRVVLYDIRYIKMSSAVEMIPLDDGSDVLVAYSISAIQVSSNLQVE